MLEGDVDGGQMLTFGGIEHSFTDVELECLKACIVELIGDDGSETILSHGIWKT